MTALCPSPGSGAIGSGERDSDLPYSDLPPTKRRSLHRAAAQALRGEAVWRHRVAAAASADESLAAALESAALVTAPAGPESPGPAQLLEWASDLSSNNDDRERRLLNAAIQRVCTGDLGSAGLWTRVEACAPSALRSCALAGRAMLDGRPFEAEFHLDKATVHTEGQRGATAAITHGLRAALCADAARGGQAVAEATAGLATMPGDHGLGRWLTRMLAAGRCYAEGPRSALDELVSSLGANSAAAGADQNEPVTALALGCYLVLAGQPREAIDVLSRLVCATEQPLPADREVRGRQWLALSCHLLGAWREAEYHARSSIEASRRPGARPGAAAHAIRSVLAAHRGDWAVADEHLRCARDFGAAGCPDDAVLSDVARAVVAHARGTPLAGRPALARLAGGRDAARKYRSLWLALRAEELVETGSLRDATAALTELRALAEQVPYLHASCWRLLGRLEERRRDPFAAGRHYEVVRALPHESGAMPFELGLLEHSYGRLLCGLGDTAEGLSWLTQARNRLLSAGAVPYARRCEADLAARKRAVDSQAGPSILTEREREVASLVTAGLTNREVAARLYVSVKTVEYHLAQIYGKLGITSRRQLARSGHEPS